jgi:hypothetical protein
LKYEQDTTNEEVELQVAQNYYFLTKGSNKQTVKFKNKKLFLSSIVCYQG